MTATRSVLCGLAGAILAAGWVCHAEEVTNSPTADVYIDPVQGTSTAGTSGDVYNTNPNDDIRYDNAALVCGNEYSPIRDRRAFMKFDLSALNGLTITSAVLHLYMEDRGNADHNGSANLRRVALSDWTASTVTYAHGSTTTSTNLATFAVATGPLPGWYLLDVRSTVQGWVSGTYSNYGFAIKQTAEGYSATVRQFTSSTGTAAQRPKLVIQYTYPSPVIDNAGGATDITPASARFNGNLVATGSLPVAVAVFWGPTDGDTNAAAWANTNFFADSPAVGPLSTNVTGLTSNLMYFYRYAATNTDGTWWATNTASFMAVDLTVQGVTPDSVDENNRTASFWIVRPETATNSALTVNYTLGGTASAGSDYTVSNPTAITLAAGISSAAVQVVTLPNNFLERDETVSLTLSNGSYGIGAPDAATLTLANGRWSRRMQIGFTGYNPPGGATPLTNFPALVILGADIPRFRYTDCLTDGVDLRFMDSTLTNSLPYEVEKWDANGSSYVWVRVPRLTDTNTHIWALWGNPLATSVMMYRTNGTTWSPEFKAVWHLQQTNAFDSTTTVINHGVSYANTNAAGLIGLAQGFNGSAHIQTGYPNSSLTMGSPGKLMTFSVWVKSTVGGYLLSKGRPVVQSGNIDYYVSLGATSVGVSRWNQVPGYGMEGASGSGPAMTDGRWHHVAVVNEGAASHRFYADGALIGSSTTLWTNDTTCSGEPVELGRYKNGPHGTVYYTGLLDEMRIEATARSSNWIWACYMNQASNSVFATKAVYVPEGTTFLCR